MLLPSITYRMCPVLSKHASLSSAAAGGPSSLQLWGASNPLQDAADSAAAPWTSHHMAASPADAEAHGASALDSALHAQAVTKQQQRAGPPPVRYGLSSVLVLGHQAWPLSWGSRHKLTAGALLDDCQLYHC